MGCTATLCITAAAACAALYTIWTATPRAPPPTTTTSTTTSSIATAASAAAHHMRSALAQVKSRVLGAYADEQRAEVRRRTKEIRQEPSIRRQRRLEAELKKFKATMRTVPPAKVPPLSRDTLLFWAKHPDLHPLRAASFDPLAPSVSLFPHQVSETKVRDVRCAHVCLVLFVLLCFVFVVFCRFVGVLALFDSFRDA